VPAPTSTWWPTSTGRPPTSSPAGASASPTPSPSTRAQPSPASTAPLAAAASNSHWPATSASPRRRCGDAEVASQCEFDAIAEYEGATIAGVDGAARGGGVELALACDLRVATSHASFAETGVSLGLFGAWGGTARLPELVGVGVAADVLLSGRTIDAREALRMGLVSRVLDDPRDAAREIAAHEPGAVRTIAALVRDRSPLDVAQEAEAKAFAERIGASDLANRNR